MKTTEKLEQVFSPLDVITIEKEYEFLCSKDEPADFPDEVFEDIKTYLLCGEYPERNPSIWYVFGSEAVDPVSPRWKKGILNLLRLSCDHKITDLDNKNNHVHVVVKFILLVVNAKTLPATAYEGVKCASVLTSYGTFPLILDEEQEADLASIE